MLTVGRLVIQARVSVHPLRASPFTLSVRILCPPCTQALGTPGHTKGSLTFLLRGPMSCAFGGDLSADQT